MKAVSYHDVRIGLWLRTASGWLSAIALVISGCLPMPSAPSHHDTTSLPLVANELSAASATNSVSQSVQNALAALHFEADPKLPARFLARTMESLIYLSATEAAIVFKATAGVGRLGCGADLGSPRNARSHRANEQLPESRRDRAAPRRRATATLRMQLAGANTRARVIGEDLSPARTTYFIGSDPTQWRSDVASYSRVKVEQVYRGVDIVYYGAGRKLEYDFKVAPRADPEPIRLRFAGARSIRLDESGELLVETVAGTLRQAKPVAYQMVEGARLEVAARYVVTGAGDVRFIVGDYDKREWLIIDPVLSYATYFGSRSGSDYVSSVAFDSAGNAYVAGTTLSNDLATTAGALQPGRHGDGRFDGDAFIAKLNPAGTELLYATYLGGRSSDVCAGLAVDATGNAYITGTTSSDDFPTSSNAFQSQKQGSLFVAKVNATGTALVYSTYLGRQFGDETVVGIAVDAAGQATIAGDTDATKFPTTPGALQPKPHGVRDVFVVRLSHDGSSLVYAAYLGGEAQDFAACLAVDIAGNAYVAGRTLSTDFPTTRRAYQKENKSGDASYLSKVSAAGDLIVYSTFIGGDFQSVTGIAVDLSGNAYVTGYTSTPNLPATPGALQPQLAGGSDIFIKKFNDTGTELVYSTFFGGSQYDSGAAIAVDSVGQAFVTGQSVSIDLPVMKPLQPAKRGGALFKSTDRGDSWQEVPVTMPVVKSLIVDPHVSATLYASTFDAILKSTDSGATWRVVLPALSGSLVIDPARSGILYVLSSFNLYRSTDAGASWQRTLFSVSVVSGLAIDLAMPDTIYLSADVIPTPGGSPSQFSEVLSGFMFKSTDGGTTWATLDLGPGVSSVRCVAVDPVTSSNIYAGAGSVLKSTNSGASWFRPGGSSVFPARLLVDPIDNATIYALTFNDLLKSTNGGASWSQTALQPSLGSTGFVGSLAIDPHTPSTLYVGGSQGLYRTTDRGASWRLSLGEVRVNAIALDPDQPSTLYAGSSATSDVFVAKLNASGSALIYSTYLGGTSADSATCIAADAYGNAYVGGISYSANFPVTPGAFKAQGAEQYTGFVIRIADPITLRITGAAIKGKKLLVSGEGFHQGAVILINGTDLETQNDSTTSAILVISKKGGRQIAPGQTVAIRVRDADGKLSDVFSFTRGAD
jgi:hypothetical protein